MPVKPEDRGYMLRALALARRGRTHPNPMVGAVVVRDGRIVGRGWHMGVGTPHAETAAFNDAGRLADGADLYVNLEPCSFTRTATGELRTPCTERCIAAGVRRVVIGMADPDVRVAGAGIRSLTAAGIDVVEGVEIDRAERLNAAYARHRRTGRPSVTHKAAMTLDGKIATGQGDSKWITGERARRWSRRVLRARADAIVVGVGTVIADDPRLTVRSATGNVRSPLRVIIDSGLRTPLGSMVVGEGTLFIGAAGRPARNVAEKLTAAGAEVVLAPETAAGRVDLRWAVDHLAGRGCLAILLEGGGELAAGFWAADLVDNVVYFVAPIITGGRTSPTPVSGEGLSPTMAGSIRLGKLGVRRLGDDLAVEGEVRRTECSLD